MGSMRQLMDYGAINEEKMSSFELYRRGQQDVEILTFDELFERARFIVESQQTTPPSDANESPEDNA